MHLSYIDYPMLEHLSDEELQQLAPEMQEEHYEPGKLIMKKGEVSQRVYILVSGQVQVFISTEIKVELAILSKGQFFGEMSCLTGDPISAHVEAIDNVHVISVSRNGMLLLMDKNREFRSQIIESMIKRIQNSNERVLEEHSKSQIIMKLHESEEQERYGELIGESVEMRTLLRSIEHLSTERVHVVVIGESGTGKVNVARALHYRATNGQYPLLVLNVADMSLVDWETKVIAAKGGTIVIEEAESCPSEKLLQLLEAAAQIRIILTSTCPLKIVSHLAVLPVPPLRERTEDIPLLAQYFLEKEGAGNAQEILSQDALSMLSLFPYLDNNVEELRNIVREAYIRSEGRMIYSHHLRFGRVRKVGDRPVIGLALGSGAARGMAHLGVLNILEQEGIPIDMIAGTSVGSMVGGAYAAGMSVKECMKVLSTISWGQLVRPTFPMRSLVHNAPIISFIEKHVGKRLIEELPIPFGAIASDVSTGEAHIMRTGSLAHAIAASTAVPVAMRPVNYQEKHLADGAIVHPVPAALVRSMGADIVIAVNVCPESFTKGAARHLIDSLMNTIDIMSAKLIKEELQLADVILRPDLGFNQISFKDADDYIAAGEVVTREAITQIRQKIAAS
ncbi:patatin-like phospholipase family protein [Paenibacillus sp. NPDC058367]|uniref:patatin-like phospholipase family protein n=1 Tax=Paenibacillus sp. NPDC058367 TaxID=3346460 RepID=UPI00365FCAF8